MKTKILSIVAALLVVVTFVCRPVLASEGAGEEEEKKRTRARDVLAGMDDIAVKRITLSLPSATVRVNQTRTLWVYYEPYEAEDKSVTWESANTEIATVNEEGVVLAVSPGTTTVTATTTNGRSASCTITVPGTVLQGIQQDAANSDLTEAQVNAGEALSAATLRVDVERAVKDAAKEGRSAAAVTYRDKTAVSTAALRAAGFTAGYESGQVTLKFLTGMTEEQGLGAQGQLTVDPTLAPAEDLTIRLGVYTDAQRTAKASQAAQQAFGPQVAVVSLSQSGGYGMLVRVAALVNTQGMNTDALRMYGWQEDTGSYRLLENQAYQLDSNGYIHFETDRGGAVVITDRQLK